MITFWHKFLTDPETFVMTIIVIVVAAVFVWAVKEW